MFLHLFPKNEKANLTKTELEVYRSLSGALLRLGEDDLGRLAAERAWRQIDDAQTN